MELEIAGELAVAMRKGASQLGELIEPHQGVRIGLVRRGLELDVRARVTQLKENAPRRPSHCTCDRDLPSSIFPCVQWILL